MKEKDDELLMVDEAATLLKINPATIRRWAKQRRVNFVMAGKQYHFRREDLVEHFAADGQQKPDSAAFEVIDGKEIYGQTYFGDSKPEITELREKYSKLLPEANAAHRECEIPLAILA